MWSQEHNRHPMDMAPNGQHGPLRGPELGTHLSVAVGKKYEMYGHVYICHSQHHQQCYLLLLQCQNSSAIELSTHLSPKFMRHGTRYYASLPLWNGFNDAVQYDSLSLSDKWPVILNQKS